MYPFNILIEILPPDPETLKWKHKPKTDWLKTKDLKKIYRNNQAKFSQNMGETGNDPWPTM